MVWKLQVTRRVSEGSFRNTTFCRPSLTRRVTKVSATRVLKPPLKIATQIFAFWTCVACLGFAAQTLPAEEAKPPNLLIIQTDEHNFRTLGCYRQQLSYEQAHVWGRGVRVDTPQIDSIARDGAICTSFYAASPVCTPSRASLVSGLYPQATGSPSNDQPLNEDIVTFAEILRRRGYATAYVGKWHLDGDAKPGWSPERKFGFEDNRFMFNRGHWKLFEQTEDGARIIGKYNPETEKYKYDINDATDKSFATDFLTDRTLEIIQREKDKPFCLMLALPDPHGPNTVRAPYDTMYQNLRFEQPGTMAATLAKTAQRPKWNLPTGKNVVTKVNQDQMAKYFGMVKCIDDNVGKLLAYLRSSGLAKNTIVVFTSDHGDMMCEHCRLNKGLPYETSAKIPFVIRYPNKIKAGKVIRTSFTTTDFAPTVLSLMGVESDLPDFHGRNGSADFLSDDKEVQDNEIVYFRNAGNRWVAAVNHRYKLVLSVADTPWLFDLDRDPDELINFYADPAYTEIATRFKTRLVERMKQFDEPALTKVQLQYE